MATQRRRQAIMRTKEIDGAGLTVVLREDAQPARLPKRNSIPRQGGFRNDLPPAELIGIPLG